MTVGFNIPALNVPSRDHDAVAKIHSDRYERYRNKLYSHLATTTLRDDKAVANLQMMQKDGVNVAAHMSRVIGDSHEEYVRNLLALGEPSFLIR